MSNELTNLHSLSEAFLKAASEMQSQALGTLLKFSKGKYFIGDDEVTGQERIAHVPAAVYGFVKFWDGKPVAQRIGRIADGFQLPDRDDLGDNDKKEWQRDSTGKEKDPWSKQYYVPMEDIDSGEITTFVTGSDGGEKALGKLFDAFARNVRNGQWIADHQTPVRQLSTSRIRPHRDARFSGGFLGRRRRHCVAAGFHHAAADRRQVVVAAASRQGQSNRTSAQGRCR
jgi:hypothetical protein